MQGAVILQDGARRRQSRQNRPLRVHLDTSDYAAMYCAPVGTVRAEVREWLKAIANRGRIQIGLSYHVLFELLQKAEPKYREDRLARARLLTDLCGRNAFPYPTDLGQGHRFSTEGLWVPRIDLEEVKVERVISELMQAMGRFPGVNRHERRVLSRRKYFAAWARTNPEKWRRFAIDAWPLRFGRAFVDDGDLGRYVLGAMSGEEANSKLRFYITDPVTVYEVWFEQYGRNDPIAERRDQLTVAFLSILEGLQRMLNGSEELRQDLKQVFAATGDAALTVGERERLVKLDAEIKDFRKEIVSPEELNENAPKWRELFGQESALVAAQILFVFHRDRRAIKPSDSIDFVHAMYLPHTDLWRGDRAFSDLLMKHRVNFSERVVPTLVDLPERIEVEIAKLPATSQP
jgi:hypothetical protein